MIRVLRHALLQIQRQREKYSLQNFIHQLCPLSFTLIKEVSLPWPTSICIFTQIHTSVWRLYYLLVMKLHLIFLWYVTIPLDMFLAVTDRLPIGLSWRTIALSAPFYLHEKKGASWARFSAYDKECGKIHNPHHTKYHAFIRVKISMF